jgi:hypothetical protein
MAGFGLRALKKVQDDDSTQNKREYIPHLVFGDNFYAALTYLKLVAEYGEDKVKLVSENTITQDSITGAWDCSLNTLRSETAAQYLMTQKPQLEILPFGGSNVFYKDTKFHKFTGRAKPHELKEDESYYLNPFFQIKKEGLFTDEQWNSLDETLASATFEKYIDSIEITEPADLVEVTNFKIKTGELETLECEQLYWCESPKTFYAKVENKDEINDGVGAYSTALEHRIGLTVHFKVDKKVYDAKGTVFLPQSVTHEWGHFIADFKEFDELSSSQEFSCMLFVNEDEVNEEDLAKKIKLMKRVIERVFPEFGKGKYKERIQYDRSVLINKTQDDLYGPLTAENIRFIGEGAPLKLENSSEYQYLARGILSFLNL